MKPISRREFGAAVAAGLLTGSLAPSAAYGRTAARAVTAQEILERIRRNVGVEWRSDTVDGFKAGDPSTGVTGVVTTSLATIDVLRQAVAAGANLVITSGPTFYGRADSRTPPVSRVPGAAPPGAPPAADGVAPPPPADAVFTAKNELIDANALVVLRLSDHWRLHRPDPFVQGLAETLGWAGFAVAGEAPRYEIPAVRLDAFASELARRLGARGGLRVVGEPATPVRSVALLPGTIPIATTLATFAAADVVVAGEIREWESSEYARDVVFDGQPKALVLTGRVLSEDGGMRRCAKWLETLVPELPVRHPPAGDPYWRPLS